MLHIDGLVQERQNSIANALELCLSCNNLSMCLMRNNEISRNTEAVTLDNATVRLLTISQQLDNSTRHKSYSL